ncbi:gliding motility-associated C-terminal domain-containing protein [Mucilaginibacter sp. ZT4R22]|uniref:Gliding motility-associated C-terminal domain-containing protein n=1 Tax=Mucilaginibacter pankratovii TaxID=2772110 RepID=A0ABR7WMY5_9SPHI|nr:MBG domain-containing protein [Mucilaginibacter pankratovii]MBD1363655.1 gliding motility-associated C-terminal domain-containing protein [Mucilaginibacter pankratovii]
MVFAFSLYTLKIQAQTIASGTASGTITGCVGSPSISPNIQQFTVTGSSLTAGITATAPANFEVSAAANNGYSNTVTLVQTGGAVNSVLYVRSATSAGTGSISGNVQLTSLGAATKDVAVHGTVNALPTVDAVPGQILSNGELTTPINFTGTGKAFSWTSNTPGIGIPASGMGNIPSFAAINTGSSPITATFTVTPVPAGFIYTANNNGNSVSVINSGDNSIVATIPVGQNPIRTIVSPDGTRIYVMNGGGNSVSVIDWLTNTVIATIPVGQSPVYMSMSPDGSWIYVSNSGSNNLTAISTITNTAVATVPVDLAPSVSAISPDGKHCYVASLFSGNISVINTQANLIEATISNINNVTDMQLSLDGSRLYITSAALNKVVVINTATNALVTSVPVGNFPLGPSLSADGQHLYVPSEYDGTVTVINTSTWAIEETIPVGAFSMGSVITPDGKFVYSVGHISQTVSVINTLNNSVVATIPVPGLLGPPSISSDGSRIYIPDDGNNTIHVINTLTNTLIATAPVGANPILYNNSISKGNGCSGTPVTFTITVNPQVPVITASGAPASLNTVFGTASTSTSFTVSGTNLPAGILVTPPPGFEVSINNSTFSSTVTIGSAGDIASTTVYIRLTSVDNAASYSGNIVLSGGAGVANVNVPMPNSIIGPAPVTITGNYGKYYGDVLTDYTLYYNDPIVKFNPAGLKNGNTFNSMELKFGAGAAANSPAGMYSGSLIVSAFTGGNGYLPGNYVFTYMPVDVVVIPAPLTIAAKNIDKPYGTTLTDLPAATDFDQTGIKNSETVGSVRITYGTGAAATAPTGVYSGSVTASNAAGGTFSPSNYDIRYVPANITVGAAPAPAITVTGPLSPVNTIYGTPSNATTFNLSGTNLTNVVNITAPLGFEVSGDNITFNNITGVGGSGGFNNIPIYIRLSKLTPVGTYSGNVLLNSAGAAPVTITMPNSTVTPALLTIYITNVNKTYGDAIAGSSASTLFIPQGLQNGESVGSITTTYIPDAASANSPVGVYADAINGSLPTGGTFNAGNYSITYIAGHISIGRAALTIIADDKTRVYGEANPVFTYHYTGFVNNEDEAQLTTLPVLTTTATAASAVGSYPITASSAIANNYTIAYVPGTLTISPAPVVPPAELVIPNTFSPNNDGVNDTWNLPALAAFPKCRVNIFNRYGTNVFTAIGYKTPWDGKYKGANLPTGVYYYVINPENVKNIVSGYVTLLR